jgi:ABC-2 type transport system permease protein
VIGPLTAILKKEFREIARSPLYVALALVVPVLLHVLFGYGLTYDVENVPIGLVDRDGTPASREYVAAITASGYFHLARVVRDEGDLDVDLTRGRIRAGLVIPAGFGRRLADGGTAEVQILLDGSWPNQATIVRGYVEAITAAFNRTRARPTAGEAIRLEPRVWFNETLESKNYIVPGVLVTTLMYYPALLASLAVVRERERGSLLNVASAPVTRIEFLAAKLIPHLAFALLNFGILLALTLLLFRVSMRGSPVLLLVGTLLYLLCTVGIGLLVSLWMRTQVAAVLLTFFATIIPAYLYSGFFTPLPSMDAGSQAMSLLIPARYYMTVARGIFLKGLGWTALWPDLLAMVLYATGLAVAALAACRRWIG